MDTKLKIAVDALKAIQADNKYARSVSSVALAAIDAEQPAQGLDERASFEAWAAQDGENQFDGHQAPGGWYYQNDEVNDMWFGWQARAALGAKQPEGEAAPKPVAAAISYWDGPTTSNGAPLEDGLSPNGWGEYEPTTLKHGEAIAERGDKDKRVKWLYDLPNASLTTAAPESLPAPQAVEALGSIDTQEFVALMRAWRDARSGWAPRQDVIDHIDASRREAWEAGRAYGILQSKEKK